MCVGSWPAKNTQRLLTVYFTSQILALCSLPPAYSTQLVRSLWQVRGIRPYLNIKRLYIKSTISIE